MPPSIFDEDTPHAIISRVQPDVLVKGADWGADNIVGRDVVEARGGRVVRMELSPGYSTTGPDRAKVRTLGPAVRSWTPRVVAWDNGSWSRAQPRACAGAGLPYVHSA